MYNANKYRGNAIKTFFRYGQYRSYWSFFEDSNRRPSLLLPLSMLIPLKRKVTTNESRLRRPVQRNDELSYKVRDLLWKQAIPPRGVHKEYSIRRWLKYPLITEISWLFDRGTPASRSFQSTLQSAAILHNVTFRHVEFYIFVLLDLHFSKSEFLIFG